MRSKKILAFVMVVCVMVLVNVASATIVQGIDIDFVTIGNAGNAGDTRAGTDDDGFPLANPYECGSVGYEYQIGKFEITNGQWDTFVTAAGAPTGNPSSAYNDFTSWTGTNIPANNVSWLEAAQFCNYLTSGDKSLGAYQFSGDNANPGDFLGIDRSSAVLAYEIVYVIPTEDEWYKAAYYTGSGYSLYANGLNTISDADNGWNYVGGTYSSPWNVGTGTIEQNGTFDIMGNVREWCETRASEHYLVARGGPYNETNHYMRSSLREVGSDSSSSGNIGFRVASVPEPTTLLLLGLGGLVLRRKKE